jgi:4-hydroxy-3-methylbut-2-en-1-yl diphosphate reductase
MPIIYVAEFGGTVEHNGGNLLEPPNPLYARSARKGPPWIDTIPRNHKCLLYLTFPRMPIADTLIDLEAPSEIKSGGGEKKILLLKPRGFCAGVVRAIDVVKIALDLYGAPIYVRKEIVHNRHVVEELRQAGAIFVEELAEVPKGARVIFSAHGVAPAVRQEATDRKLLVIDATCPLVTKVHLEAVKLAKQGFTIVLIGHRHHDEVIGTLGEAPESTILVSDVGDVDRLQLKSPERVAYLTQTTLSLDETKDIVTRLLERFPKIVGPKTQDICYATENRQLAVKAVAPLCDTLLVVGSQNSSNSRRLVEVCEKAGIPAYLLDDSGEVEGRMLTGVNTVAVTAGASAPEHLVEELISHLRAKGFVHLEEVEIKEEDVRFTLPSDLEKFTPRLHPVRA